MSPRKRSRKSSVSSTVFCIFQLAARYGLRSLIPRPFRSSHPARARPRRGAPSLRAARATPRRPSRASPRPGRGRTRRAPPRSPRPRRPCAPGRLRPPRRRHACPAANGSISNAPIGPFQSTDPASAIASAYRLVVCGTDVEAHPAVRHLDPVDLLALGVRRKTSRRSRGPSAGSARSRERSAASRTLRPRAMPSSSTSESPVPTPRARKKLKHIAPPTRTVVRDLEEALEDADLVRHLRPAEDHDQRALGIVAQGRQLGQLALEQEARVGRQEVSHPLGRRVRAMGGAEGVVHVEVGRARRALRRGPGRSRSPPPPSGCSRAAAPGPARAARLCR